MESINASEAASSTTEAASVLDDTPDEAIVFLSVEDVIHLHRSALEHDTPNEPQGILNVHLLESAVLNPQQTFFGQYLYTSLEDMATAYLVGLAQNHSFEQGNKRVAFAACRAFLNLNSYDLTLTQQEAIDLTLNVVNGLIERDAVAEIIANHTTHLD